MQTLNDKQQKTIEKLVRFLRVKNRDLSEDEIYKMAKERCLGETWFAAPRTRQLEAAKTYLRSLAEQEIDLFGLDDLRIHMKELALTQCNSNNGIGDLVGRKGLFLEWSKISGKKQYKVPSLPECSDWYDGEPFLPPKYYSPSFLNHLVEISAASKDQRFYDHFMNLLEKAEVGND